MGIKDKLKDLIFEEDQGEGKPEEAQEEAQEEAKEEEPKGQEPQRPKSRPKSTVFEPQAQSLTAAAGEANPKIYDMLMAAIGQSGFKSQGYLELIKGVNALDKIVPDEATRFKSAFAMASTGGMSLQNVLLSIDYYLDVLKKEKDKFQSTLEGQLGSIKSLESDVEAKKKDIARLQDEQAELERRIAADKAKIAETTGGFNSSFDKAANKLSSDKEKIVRYLSS